MVRKRKREGGKKKGGRGRENERERERKREREGMKIGIFRSWWSMGYVLLFDVLFFFYSSSEVI